jgi:glycolate dehydrogenase FAD-binding subunit
MSCDEIADAIQGALARGEGLEIVGHGTKRKLGRPVEATSQLSLATHVGIVSYEPEELVITARAGTPLTAIEDAVTARGQMLAFEPPDYGPLFGEASGNATLGGIIATNASGSRRMKSGAARDHVLGMTAISGRGEVFKAGGKVVKNVTGYDLPKLIAGSFGTLAVIEQATLKLAPRPEADATLVIEDLDDHAALDAMTSALQGAFDLSGAAHLPAGLDCGSGVTDWALTTFRLDGFRSSLRERVTALQTHLLGFGKATPFDDYESHVFWRAVRDLRAFDVAPGCVIWRLSLPPAASADVVARIRERLPDAQALYDWGGALVWLGVPGDASRAALVRNAVRAAGGHAMLFRAPETMRAREDVFPPLDAPLAALQRRVKAQFDPGRVLNPGRMYKEI